MEKVKLELVRDKNTVNSAFFSLWKTQFSLPSHLIQTEINDRQQSQLTTAKNLGFTHKTIIQQTFNIRSAPTEQNSSQNSHFSTARASDHQIYASKSLNKRSTNQSEKKTAENWRETESTNSTFSEQNILIELRIFSLHVVSDDSLRENEKTYIYRRRC